MNSITETGASAPSAPPQTSPEPPRKIPLAELFRLAWRNAWILVAAGVVGLGIAWVYLANATPLYTVQMLIVPDRFSKVSKLADRVTIGSGGGGALAGLGAALAQPAALDFEFEQWMELLLSHTLAERLAKDDRIMHTVFSSAWDRETRTWQQPHSFVADLRYTLRGLFGLPEWTPPSPNSLSRYIRDNVKLNSYGKVSTRVVELNHADPEFAKYFLARLYEEAETYYREASRDRIMVQLTHVKEKLNHTLNPDHRQVLGRLLEEQERALMVMQPDIPYVTDLVQKPIASDMPTSPRLGLSLFFGLAGGMAVGLLIAGLRELRRARVI